jgi:hypothetical protein
VDVGKFNINWFKFEPLATAPDTTAPASPSATIDATRKVISGTAEPGSVVVAKNANNTSTLGTITAHATTGAYSIVLTTALANKEIVNITATDAAGNVSAAYVIQAPDVAVPNPTAITIQAESYTSMSGIQKENTTDVGGGQNLGYIDPGDWMAYDNVAFNVPAEGRYKVTYRVSSLNGGARLTLKESSNDSALGSVDIPKTGAWQSWIDVTQEITLSAGVHNFKLAVDVGKFNINWFRFEPLAPAAPDTASAGIVATDAWYGSPSDRVSSILMGTESGVLSSQIDTLIQSMASFAPPVAAETTLVPLHYDVSQSVIAVNV